MENVDLLGQQVKQGKQEHQDPEVSLVYKDQQDNEEKGVVQVLLEHLETLVSRVKEASQEILAVLDSLAPKDQLDHKAAEESLVQEEHLVPQAY